MRLFAAAWATALLALHDVFLFALLLFNAKKLAKKARKAAKKETKGRDRDRDRDRSQDSDRDRGREVRTSFD